MIVANTQTCALLLHGNPGRCFVSKKDKQDCKVLDRICPIKVGFKEARKNSQNPFKILSVKLMSQACVCHTAKPAAPYTIHRF